MDFTLLPPGTIIRAPNEGHVVEVEFPDEDSAIVFHEFMRGYCAGEYDLTATPPDVD